MRSSEPSDPELLAEWLEHQREPAFRSLVARYAGLVHMTAMRTCGDDSIAAEATQLTFITLAQKAKSLATCATLGGWLHRTAMMQAKNLLRKSERENRKRQQLAMEPHSHSQDETWREMQPVLDGALASLSDKDREALLLRFYRSLTIREVAETLGIATDAAQKRIDRATERLRGKLLRRGVQTGGSLSAAMLAGLAADAQAALPVSILASKAIAAGGAGAGSTIACFLNSIAINYNSIVAPLVVLFAGGTWIATQRHSIAMLEQQNKLLESRLATDSRGGSAQANPRVRVSAAKTGTPINWGEVAARLHETLRKDQVGFNKLKAEWNLRLSSMSRDELVAALDEIAALELPAESRNLLEEMLVGPLILHDPELVLDRFGDRLQDDQSRIFWQLTNTLAQWAERDPAKATAWLDQRIASGHLDATTLDGKNPARLKLEAGLVGSLLLTDPNGAMRRISNLAVNERKDALTNLSQQRMHVGAQAAFADMVRQYSPEVIREELIANAVIALPARSYFPEVLAYLERIKASPAERAACVERAVFFGMTANRENIATKDLEKLRSLAGEIKDDARRDRVLNELK